MIAAKADPNNPDPWLYLGLNASKQRDNATAETYLRKAITLTGDDTSRNGYNIRRGYIALARILASEGKKPNKRIVKPLAIVFTKMDALLHDLKETSPLLRSPPQEGYFDERDSLEVHAEIQRLLARWEGTRIDQIAQLNYRSYRYFGVSALGETPTQDNRVAARGIRPYRVASPILWILAQFGIIPVKRG